MAAGRALRRRRRIPVDFTAAGNRHLLAKAKEDRRRSSGTPSTDPIASRISPGTIWRQRSGDRDSGRYPRLELYGKGATGNGATREDSRMRRGVR
jgi:hypothetical protein